MIDTHPATSRHAHLATKWRNNVAVGVSPWIRNPHHAGSPEGTIRIDASPSHVAPSGLLDRICPSHHGFAPVATSSRSFETHVLTPGSVAYKTLGN